jgi:hypothetical protein
MEVKPNAMDARNPEHPTRLNDQQFETCWKTAKAFLAENKMIRNKQLREITGIGYDQAIFFFNRAVTEKRLLRQGVSSSTHYVLKD